MIITDIPDSGVYMQKGGIVRIAVRILDAITGDPRQIQTATNMKIILLYPSKQIFKIFVASLLTDGSDGIIVYTTQNDGGGNIDLSQVGLFKIQGQVTIGGVALPPSSENDFYILPNPQDQANIPSSIPILIDSKGGFWQLTILPTGNLDTVPTGSSINAVPSLTLEDAAGNRWTLSVLPTGNLDTEPV